VKNNTEEHEEKKLDGLFKIGELYALSKKNTEQFAKSLKKENKNKFIIIAPPGNSNPVFFNFSHDVPFKDPISLPYDTPMVYLGVEEKWGARTHVFLHGNIKVFTLGVFNSAPLSFWKKILT
jgi:hypothetical protein